MFISAIAGEKAGPFPTFTETFCFFFQRALYVASHGQSLQILETSCWIIGDFGDRKIPMMFSEARDLAFDLGILVGDGEFHDPAPEVDPEIVESAFLSSALRAMSGFSRELREALSEAVHITG